MRFYSIPLFITSIIIFSSCRNSKTAESLCENQSEITTSLQATTANTEYGKVAGYIENGIYIYKGIPYAEAERFMPPTKVTKWDGVRSSRSYGPTSPQGKRMGWYSDEQAFAFDWNDGYQDEDCLRLNIWTPGINGNQKGRLWYGCMEGVIQPVPDTNCPLMMEQIFHVRVIL